MLPTVVTTEIERALLDYLQTTFHLRDKLLEAELLLQGRTWNEMPAPSAPVAGRVGLPVVA